MYGMFHMYHCKINKTNQETQDSWVTEHTTSVQNICDNNV